MRRIRLEDFRCYEKQTINFKPGINLLVGDNASGKTSVLKACKYVLGSFFAGFSDENTSPKWCNFHNDDFRRDIRYGDIARLKPISIFFENERPFVGHIEFPPFPRLVPVTAFEQDLTKSTKNASRTSLVGIREYKSQCRILYKEYYNDDNERILPLPLFASFSAKDYENINAKDKKKFKDYYHVPSFGYYECLDNNNNFKNWINRLLVLEEGGKNLQDIDIVKSAIINALGVGGCNIITSMEVRNKQGNVYYILTDEREMDSDSLSDGYKRIVNIVTDLAFRCVHLNRGMYDRECCKETRGTVLIDEIDLHLHPTLQSTILKGLRNAFPKLQFIVSSHAPMVMSSVKSNEENIVYKLDYTNEEGYSVNEVNTYGMDISTISEIVLNQTPREQVTQDRLDRLFDLIDDDKTEEAWQLLNELKSERGDALPELSQAEAMLNFIISN